ncbi:MAG: 30S ribosomal protein S7 [Candidatus Wallbacteria bacterium]|nr:30S ribosomal protein S7 [Candidatus Wallbacteria bacterium]MBI4867813.1 30S ribosomal protein S7 [Candidatus Wallbacteria bacterium]
MARRRAALKREVQPDPIFNSRLVTRFINKIMLSGKKTLASRMFYDAVKSMSAGGDIQEGYKAFEQAVENVKPAIEVKSRRVGGSTYQVPVEVRGPRKLTLAIRWLITHSRSRKEKTFSQRLAGELSDAAKGQGLSIKKREDVHKMAEANRAFSHYRW